ncbi:hypothetical protein Pmani_022591 [Petrolisthes manimaculis]|uniref:Secreted protein n=1 Tax=Petrolisthes manimaculis TaxID=1843537 RepID=A0AAE1U454_9EUCA|nr:hypothetical protein Pmani_022591 [Petrolisthes manimaculis]
MLLLLVFLFLTVLSHSALTLIRLDDVTSSIAHLQQPASNSAAKPDDTAWVISILQLSHQQNLMIQPGLYPFSATQHLSTSPKT